MGNFMGYTHYWYRPQELKGAAKFKEFAADCRKIFSYCENELGIKLADSMGEPGTNAVADINCVAFNGSEEQPSGVWTTAEQISIPWPSAKASLVEENADPSADKTDGHWFAGNLVSQRVAPLNNKTGKGSGSYESVYIDRIFDTKNGLPPREGLYFECCKTAYRPYDLTVTAVLIALKHHFPEVVIKSDGEDKDWLDGKFLCNNLLGYGIDFSIDD